MESTRQLTTKVDADILHALINLNNSTEMNNTYLVEKTAKILGSAVELGSLSITQAIDMLMYPENWID
jgi:hypothetical protein